ncbi:MAG: LPS export ABC transporter ATP-binding protein [Methylococcales bacterium]|nr:LPS export ABC transporter ATP-binding protein [Methylococcales bacterium]
MILVAKNLQKNYNKRAVVNGVSLHVKTGEVVGLLGPNGAGKTTSFYMLVGLIKADGGNITINEQSITHMPMHIRAKNGIGYLPQEPSVFRKLSVADNLRAVLQLRSDLNAGQIELQIMDLMDEFSVTHLKNQLALSLSGGERRRVEIARALASNPKFILLDEPFAGVDPISVDDIKKIIQHLTKRGIGVLITEHNVRETLDICHRAYILSDGKVIAEGGAEEIVANKEVRDVYLGTNFSL